jgi:hypothetical protein
MVVSRERAYITDTERFRARVLLRVLLGLPFKLKATSTVGRLSGQGTHGTGKAPQTLRSKTGFGV